MNNKPGRIRGFFSDSRELLVYQNLISISRLHKLKNLHHGKRCFIIGNGPSLANTDLTLLRNEFIFGTNRFYILFDQLDFFTSYYVSIDEQIITQYKDDINSIQCQKFILWTKRKHIHFDRKTIFLRCGTRVNFWNNPIKKLFRSGSVTYVAMQLAFHMGFSKVILIGVDHKYSVTRTGKDQVNLLPYNGDNRNHFSKDYYEEGHYWVAPDIEKQELGYRIAKYVYYRNGREIIDATIGGNLDVFPKVAYKSLF